MRYCQWPEGGKVCEILVRTKWLCTYEIDGEDEFNWTLVTMHKYWFHIVQIYSGVNILNLHSTSVT